MKTSVVNQSTRVYFTGATGRTDFSTLRVVNDGVIVTPVVSTLEVGTVPGLYTSTFTPTSTGDYVLFLDGLIIAEVKVVTKDIYSFLQNIEDEALGSWTWNKQLGKLTMVRQDGTTLGEFDVVENMTTASRERI